MAAGGGGGDMDSWMQSPLLLSPVGSSSPPSPYSCRGRGTEEKNTISLFKPKQTHSGLKIQHESVECREDVWWQGVPAGGEVGGRRPRRSWDSSLYFPILKGSEGAPGQFQMARLMHHLTLQQPSTKQQRRPSSLALQRVWLAGPAD